MKCPKCGSELDTVFNCPKCKAKSYKEIVSEYNTNGEKIYEKNTIKLVQPEPTTAEMLLWLAENESIDIWHTATEGIIYVWRNGNAVKFEGKTLSEAIKQAYDWARKEEQNDRD